MTQDAAARWKERIRKSCFLVALAVFLNASVFDRPAQAHGFFDFRKFAPAINAIIRRDCKAAWEMMWPLAKEGDRDAQHFLSTAMTAMVFPGADISSREDLLRPTLILGMNGALSTTPFHPTAPQELREWPRTMIPFYISLMSLGANGERVAECYKSDSSYQTCLSLAESLGVVQPFKEFARGIDDAVEKTGAAAQCRPRPKD